MPTSWAPTSPTFAPTYPTSRGCWPRTPAEVVEWADVVVVTYGSPEFREALAGRDEGVVDLVGLLPRTKESHAVTR